MNRTSTGAIAANAVACFSSRSIQQSLVTQLFQPLPFLLAAGGDDRIAIDPTTRANRYGARTYPARDTFAFSSSTASTISERSYAHAYAARERILKQSIASGFVQAFDDQMECLRGALTEVLRLEDAKPQIMFAPSGTDAQVQAFLLIRELMDRPVSSVLVGADQTGSGAFDASRGFHFATRTAQGAYVVKAAPIANSDAGTVSIGVALCTADGAPRPLQDVDAEVISAVGEQVLKGRTIILQIMDSSKLGWRAPSETCVQEVCSRWPENVQVVVDACQMRSERARLRDFVDRGYVVLITGSKFFAGPAFSGASIWPQALAAKIAGIRLPAGLDEYATQFDAPPHWPAIRAALPAVPNVGQWLRWEGALAEMQAYFALSRAHRQDVLRRLADAVSSTFARSRYLELHGNHVVGAPVASEDMPTTIFPFRVRLESQALDFNALTNIYRALNRDMSLVLPGAGRSGAISIASAPCQIGQPVRTPGGAFLRLCTSARHVVDVWSDDAAAADRNVEQIATEMAVVVDKLDCLVRHQIHRESAA